MSVIYQPTDEVAEKKRKRSPLALLLLPLMCGAIFCAAQLGLLISRPDQIDTQVEAIGTADYGQWTPDSFQPVNPMLGTIVAVENGAPTPVSWISSVAFDSTSVFNGPLPIQTMTPTLTPTATVTSTPTSTQTSTPTATFTPSITSTPSATTTESVTPSLTNTVTRTPTRTPTSSVTPSRTPTSSITPTRTNTPTRTSTASITPTRTPTPTNTPITAPTANFSANPTFGSLPLTVNFTNLSTGVISNYLWDFGDTVGFSASANPSYTYINPGSYTVTLTVTGPGGSTSRTLVISVSVPTNTPVPATSTPTLTLTPTATLTNTPLPTADLALTMTVSNATPIEGQTIFYRLTATNAGPNNGTGVQITDILPAGVTFTGATASQGGYSSMSGIWNVGVLNVGATATLDLFVTINNGTGGTTISNNAGYSSTGVTDPNASNNTAAVNITALSAATTADLRVTLNSNNMTPAVGSTFRYTLVVINNGPAGATGVQLSDVLPATLTFQSSVGAGTYDSATGLWNVGNIAPGSSATRYIDVRVNLSASNSAVTNTLNITASGQTDPNTANNSASITVNVPPDTSNLSISKGVSTNQPAEGQTITYTITVDNPMAVTDTGVVVSDILPTEITYVSDDSGGTYDPATGIWNVGTVTSGSNRQLQIQVTVDSGTMGATVSNTADIIAATQPDSDNTNNTDTVTFTVTQGNLSVNKSVSDTTPTVGTNINYRITVTNSMIVDDTAVEITDALPPEVTWVSDDSGGAYNPGSGVWTVGTVPALSSVQLNITVTVNLGTEGNTVVNTADITNATEPDLVPANNSDSVAITPLGVATDADLAINKTVDDATPNEGDIIRYTIVVSNNGPDNASGVVVQDILPAGVTFFSSSSGSYDPATGIWNVGNVLTSSTRTLTIDVFVDSGTGGSPPIVNAASITASNQADADNSNNADSVSITVQAADLAVTKIVNDTTPGEGQLITYTVSVINNGPDATTGVQITDQLPFGLTYVNSSTASGTYNAGTGIWDIGALASGATATLTIDATVNVGTTGGTITNTASITVFSLPDPVTANNSASVTITVQSADLTLSKIVSNGTPNINETVIYTVSLTNNGANTATGVAVSDVLPAGVTYVSSTESQGTYNSGSGTWTVGTVNNGATVTLSITVTVNNGTAGAVITNTTSVVASDQSDPNTADNTASVGITIQSADLVVNKIVNNTTPSEGDFITYNISVINNGPSPATNVTVNDLLPAGVTYGSNTPSQGVYDNVSGNWSLGTIPNGSAATLNITATVNNGVGNITINNTALVTAVDQTDLNPGNESASVVIDIQVADLGLGISVNNPTPNEGASITYTIFLNNNGPDTATGIIISDLLPAGLSYVANTPSQGTYNNISGNWSVGSLASGAGAVLNIVATVGTGTGNTTITNTASVVAVDQTDGAPGNESASVNIDVQSADLAISLNSTNPTPIIGSSFNYVVTVLNNGPDTATTIGVSAPLPAGVGINYISHGLTQGVYNPITGAWTGINLANGASATLTINVTYNGGSPSATIGSNASIAAADQADPNAANNTASTSITVPNADLGLGMISSNLTPTEGTTFTYTITLTNAGPYAATSVTVSDVLPSGVTYNTSFATVGGYNNLTGVWTVGSIAASGSATLDISVTVNIGTAGTPITNTANISGLNEVEINPGNNSAFFTFTP